MLGQIFREVNIFLRFMRKTFLFDKFCNRNIFMKKSMISLVIGIGAKMGKHELLNTECIKEVLDSFDGIAYIADIETHDLVFLNRQLKSYLKIEDDSYRSRKCYKVLQGMDKPCEFCTNTKLTKGKTFVWNRYHQSLQRYFELKDSVLEINNRNYRLEFGVDISEIKELMDEMEQKILVEKVLVKCASTLCNVDDVDYAISIILESMVQIFDADRAYLFEYDKAAEKLVGTYSFSKEGAKPFRDILSVVSVQELQSWLQYFSEKGKVYYHVTDRDIDKNSVIYQEVKERCIENMLILPIHLYDSLEGLIGLDNVRHNLKQFQILVSVAMFIVDHLRKRKLIERLDYLSNVDELTGLYNRNKYMEVLREIRDKKENVGILYIDLNGLKQINDRFGHEKGDAFIKDTVEFLKKYFVKNIYRIGGDEFVVLLRRKPKQDFGDLLMQFKEDLKRHEGSLNLSFGEEYCENGNVDDCIKHADELMFTRKRRYYSSRIYHGAEERKTQ